MKDTSSIARRLAPHALALVAALTLLVALIRLGTHVDFDGVTVIWPEPPMPRALEPRALESSSELVVASFAPREASPRVVIPPRPSAAPHAPEPTAIDAPRIELPAPPEVATWVRDLASDNIPHNADIAARKLRHRADAIVELRGALRSLDDQQRHYAAQILYSMIDEPEDDLLSVAVESLAIDRHRDNIAVFRNNANLATGYLIEHAQGARHRLRRSLSGDPQERFLAAYILAKGGVEGEPEPLVDVLVRHLPDDDRRVNAVLAREALDELGSGALPRLRVLTRDVRDPQTRAIAAELEGGPRVDLGGYRHLTDALRYVEDREASRWP